MERAARRWRTEGFAPTRELRIAAGIRPDTDMDPLVRAAGFGREERWTVLRESNRTRIRVLLSQQDEGATREEIAEATGIAAQRVAETLGNDRWAKRIRQNVWVAASAPQEKYEGVPIAIARLIGMAGGRIRKDELRRTMAERFGTDPKTTDAALGAARYQSIGDYVV